MTSEAIAFFFVTQRKRSVTNGSMLSPDVLQLGLVTSLRSGVWYQDLLLLLAWLCDRYAALVPTQHSVFFHNPIMAIPDGIVAGMVEKCPHNGISPDLECGGWMLVGLSAISAYRIGAKALRQPLQRLRSSLAASTTTTSGGARVEPS